MARKENIPRIIPPALQKAVKYIGVIFSQLGSCHLGISLERYSLKDSVWNCLISVTKYFFCLPFPVPLDLYSQEFYNMLILHSKEKKPQTQDLNWSVCFKALIKV